jgi:hypothetical protein
MGLEDTIRATSNEFKILARLRKDAVIAKNLGEEVNAKFNIPVEVQRSSGDVKLEYGQELEARQKDVEAGLEVMSKGFAQHYPQ